jgi:hypothetical protein
MAKSSKPAQNARKKIQITRKIFVIYYMITDYAHVAVNAPH